MKNISLNPTAILLLEILLVVLGFFVFIPSAINIPDPQFATHVVFGSLGQIALFVFSHLLVWFFGFIIGIILHFKRSKISLLRFISIVEMMALLPNTILSLLCAAIIILHPT